MYNYDIGDKVVCVNGDFYEGINRLYKELPKQDQVYVVREMNFGVALAPGYPAVKTGEVSVLLIGINNPKSNTAPFRERGFAGWRFEKLQAKVETESKPKRKRKELQNT